MAQIHKKFTDEQVKDLMKRYLNKEVERKYLQEIFGIGKSRFFELVGLYRQNEDGFSIQYTRKVKTKRISQSIENNIIKELKIDKKIIENKDTPVNRYNYSYIKTQFFFEICFTFFVQTRERRVRAAPEFIAAFYILIKLFFQ